MASHSTKEFDLALISEVKKYSLIFMPDHTDYRNPKKRHDIWERIGHKLDIDPIVCRKRWGWMKTNFVRYTPGIQGVNSSNRKRTVPYFDRLRVLLEKGETEDDFSKNTSNSNTTQREDTTTYSHVCSSTLDASMESTNADHQYDEVNQMLNAKTENIDLTMDDEDSVLDIKSDDIVINDSIPPIPQSTTGLSYPTQEIVYEDVPTTQPSQSQPLPPPPQQQIHGSHNYNYNNNSVLREDECQIAGKRIGLQLKGVEDFQRTIAEKLISDIVYFAKMGNLNEHSAVVCNRNNCH